MSFYQSNGALSLSPWFIVVLFFVVVDSWMNANTCFDNKFHWKYLFELSYYLFCRSWWYWVTIYCYIICYKYVIVFISWNDITQSFVLTKHNKHFSSDPIKTGSIIPKLGVIYFSVVLFHLVHSSVNFLPGGGPSIHVV